MGTLRSARRGVLATFVALLISACAVAMAGPVAGSVETKPVHVRVATTSVLAVAASQLQAAWDDRMAHTVVVFGDSITARFNDTTGDDLQGYWSMVADAVGAQPSVHAEGGSGFVNPGETGCTGHTLGQQLSDPMTAKLVAEAAAVLVEGGRTDTQTCAEHGGYTLIANAKLRSAATDFFRRVAKLRGADDKCTFALIPWGPAGLTDNRDRVTWEVSNAAKKFGFTYVNTYGLLTEQTTLEDRVHPDRSGNLNLAKAVLDDAGARACF